MRECGRPQSHTRHSVKNDVCEFGVIREKDLSGILSRQGPVFCSFLPQTASLQWRSRPPIDLGYATNKWKCTSGGQSQLQQLFFKKKKKK